MNKTQNVGDIRKAGNAAMEKKNYELAIKIYSDALQTKKLPIEEKGLLHSNRSYAYLMSAMEKDDDNGAKVNSALKDANEVILIRPTWWKGYFRAGQVYKYRKEWDHAIDRFNDALALNGALVEARNYRDECRVDKMQTEINDNVISHGFKEEVDKMNEVYGTKFDAANIVKMGEELMASKDPKNRVKGLVFSGIRYIKGIDAQQDIKKGVGLLQEAIDANSPEAMVEMGILHMQGIGGVERNIKKAVSLFEKAANINPKSKTYLAGENDGVAHAQFHIGLCFENGTGKPVDHYQARLWYEKASERGHSGAANNLAILYVQGLGGPKCSTRASQFFRLSASRGNTAAMESLAWKYLQERDVEQAESWYSRALEAGNNHAIQNKSQFYEMLENVRRFVKEINVQRQSNSSGTGAEPSGNDVANLIETLVRVTSNKPSISQIASAADSPVAQYWKQFDEIQRRAENGYPFAQTLLTSMNYFAVCVSHLNELSSTKKMSPSDVAFNEELCLHNLANCLRTTEIIIFFEPPELQRLSKMCKSKVSNRRSDLDLSARIVQCFMLSVSQNSEFFSFSRVCLEIYPDEMFFYKMHAASFAIRQDFEASMKVSDQGLKKFPGQECLLFCKAGAMKMIKSSKEEQVIAAYEEFIKYAPFDERMIPEAYYNMAFYSSDDEQDAYYKKGIEAEQNMLPSLLPYKSNVKSLLNAFMALGKKGKKNEPTTATTTNATKPVDLQVTNPARVQSVQRHRETLKKMTEMHRTINYKTQLTITPQHEQKMSKRPDGFTAITMRDMNPHKDMVYNKRLINLLICEDPMLNLLSAIHVVVRDDNDDCMICSFYGLDHNDKNVRENLAFGSQITVLNPYYRLATDGGVALRVDDPKTIIYRECGKDNPICRYCWKKNPQHSCGQCKRVKYCSRSCQTNDWKILKHKMICGLKYFENM